MSKSVQVFIALGSNMGDKSGYLHRAIAELGAHRSIQVVRTSRFYRTEPWGDKDQDWFVNACVDVATTLSPQDLLAVCQSIENGLGRVRKRRWGPRVIDVDILTFEGVEQDTPELTLPHPRITERAFVLVPLHDLAPDLMIKAKPVHAWLQQIDTRDVTPLDEGT